MMTEDRDNWKRFAASPRDLSTTGIKKEVNRSYDMTVIGGDGLSQRSRIPS